MAGIFQHHAHLLVEVLVQVALQLGNGLRAQAVHNRLGAGILHLGIESFVRIDAHQRSRGAGSHAAGFADENFLAGVVGRFLKSIAQLVRALACTGQVHADIHLEVILCVVVVNPFGNQFQFF